MSQTCILPIVPYQLIPTNCPSYASQGKYFAVICEFKKCLTRDGWFYDGCSRCGTKPTLTNGVASCGNNYCRSKRCTVESKYDRFKSALLTIYHYIIVQHLHLMFLSCKLRLNYLIVDESGTASIVLFNKQATELLKRVNATRT